MEEDIKILERVCENFRITQKRMDKSDKENLSELISVKEIQAIENLIARNKELEESHGTAYNAGKAFKQHQWKDKITKLLEKLDKEEQDLQNSISDEEREEYSDAMISWQLCDIDGKRKMLQELLKN